MPEGVDGGGEPRLRRLIKRIRPVERSPHVDQSVPTEFSAETRQALEKKGYTIIQLRGKTLLELRRPEYGIYGLEGSGVWEAPSRRTQVAVNLNNPFLSGTERLRYHEEEGEVSRYSQRLGLKGARAIIGSASDHLDLADVYHETEGVYLLDESPFSVRTSTPVAIGSGDEATVIVGLNRSGYRGNTRVNYSEIYGKFKSDSSLTPDKIMPLVIPI